MHSLLPRRKEERKQMTVTNLNSLYEIAENNNIAVYSFDTATVPSLSVQTKSGSFIGINPMMLSSEQEEMVCLAHELGHCINGAFYNTYSPFDIRKKHETKADIWAIKKLIPKNELIKQYKKGNVTNEELADYFGVSLSFLEKALAYYTEKRTI